MMDGGPAPEAGLALTVAGASPADADRGVARVAPARMADLGLRAGDTVAVVGRRTTHVRLLPARGPAADPDAVALDESQRANAGLALGDRARLAPAALPAAERIVLALDGGAPAPAAADLRSGLLDQPVTEGDRLTLHVGRGRTRLGAVRACAPGPAARVVETTEIALDQAETAGGPYAAVGGLEAQIAKLREMVETPLKRPDLFRHLGIAPPRGVLFTGPPGSGKTLLARAAAEASDAAFFQINGPEIVSKHYGDSEAKLREVFAAAEKRAPAIVFIDEIDAIAPKRDGLSGEKQLERRVVAQLLTLMDGLSDRGQVVVMAATNLPNAIDPALRRPGRFDRELVFSPPDRAGRRAILAVHLGPAPLAPDADLDAVAAETHGFVGADLAALAREAAMAALARATAAAGGVERVALRDLAITGADLAAARAVTNPSVLRETHVEIPETRWSDIGGLAAAKQALTEAVIWPLAHAGLVAELGVRPVSGVLLAGPPGGGKTLLARALAAESRVNFMPVRGARLLSQYFGAAERAVAEVFAQARQAAPCIMFLDEVDALAPARGRSDGAMERVVAQLLVEIDGVERSRGVFVLGATNRVDAIDPALLRPGRFDLVIELDPPDAAERAEILAVHLRAMPLAPGIEAERLAAETKGWSGADLAALCQSAGRHALRRALRAAAAAAPTDAAAVEPRDFAAAAAECARSRAARTRRPSQET